MNKDRRNIAIIILIIAAFVFSTFTIYVSSSNTPSLSAKSAVLYEPETKTYIYEKNSTSKLPMASTTKIMTAMVACDHLDKTATVTVPKEAVGVEGSSAYFVENERMSLEDSLYALLLQSANDAAVTIAYNVCGGIDEFSSLMNTKAVQLGIYDTHFTNPHGLDDKNHYTTAKDLAIITAEALNYPLIKKIVSTYKKSITTSEKDRIFVNHNKLLYKYENSCGVKTGYTRKCGRCLVGAAEKDGLSLISVTLNAPDDWNDHIKLFECGFSLYEKRLVVGKGEYSYSLPVINGENTMISCSNEKEFSLITKKTSPKIRVQISLSKFVVAPVLKGDILGNLNIYQDGKLLETINIVSDRTINKNKESNIFKRLFQKIIK